MIIKKREEQCFRAKTTTLKSFCVAFQQIDNDGGDRSAKKEEKKEEERDDFVMKVLWNLFFT